MGSDPARNDPVKTIPEARQCVGFVYLHKSRITHDIKRDDGG